MCIHLTALFAASVVEDGTTANDGLIGSGKNEFSYFSSGLKVSESSHYCVTFHCMTGDAHIVKFDKRKFCHLTKCTKFAKKNSYVQAS